MTQKKLQRKERYIFPDRIDSIGVRLNLVKGRYANVKAFVRAIGYCFAADLINVGFAPYEIETVVNAGFIQVASWPKDNPKTELFWTKNSLHEEKLEKLANQVTQKCFRHGCAINDFRFDNLPNLVVGLIYAREKGTLQESNFGGETLYVGGKQWQN